MRRKVHLQGQYAGAVMETSQCALETRAQWHMASKGGDELVRHIARIERLMM